jgi:hypothetical protein
MHQVCKPCLYFRYRKTAGSAGCESFTLQSGHESCRGFQVQPGPTRLPFNTATSTDNRDTAYTQNDTSTLSNSCCLVTAGLPFSIHPCQQVHTQNARNCRRFVLRIQPCKGTKVTCCSLDISKRSETNTQGAVSVSSTANCTQF